REGAGKALAQALDGKEGDAWLAHAETILVRNPSDPAVARWLLEYSARREAALRGTDDAGYAFSSLWSHAAQALVRAGRPDEPVDIMVRALENARRDGQEAPALAAFLRGRLNSEIKTTLEGAEAAFPALRPRLIDLGVRLPPALPVRLSWTAGQKDRTIYKQRHLDDFLTAIRAEAETARKAGPLSPAQTAALERAEARVPELLRLGVLSGMPEGRTQRDRLSERVSRILYDGYSAFKADFFAGEMRRAGFAPKGGSGTDIDILFYPSYSKEEVRRLTDHLKTILASGRGFDYDGKRPPLETLERDMLQAQVAALEALLRDYPESP
ncbi:MAG TPA: hypothetical protein VNI01_06355, partial [Elusimicrobiota bacterium]|nr:hypothetical protein [Elusimicrobiota bacterium]